MKQNNTEQFLGYAGKYLAGFLLYLALLISSSSVQADDVVVAVQKNTPAIAPISRYVLSAIFGMRLTTWPDGTAIRVFVLADENHLNSLFCKQILHIFPHQLRTAWDRLVYSGTGQAPVVLGSELEMRTRIANTPGAIGYLTKETLDDTVAILPVE
jgi:ABC-type phosphate transport system substrate-binding protein